MKHKLFLILFFFVSAFLFSQNKKEIERLEKKLQTVTNDTIRVKILNDLSGLTSASSFKKSYKFGMAAMQLADKYKNVRAKVEALNNIGDAYWYHSDFINAETYYFKAYKLNDSLKDEAGTARSMYNVGWILVLQQEQMDKAYYLFNSLKIYEKLNDVSNRISLLDAVGNYYTQMYSNTSQKKYLDSAIYFYDEAIKVCRDNKYDVGTIVDTYINLGELMFNANDLPSAKFYFQKSYDISLSIGDSANMYYNLNNFAAIAIKENRVDEAIVLLKRTVAYGQREGLKQIVLVAYGYLNDAYFKKENFKMAYEYLKMHKTLNDSLNHQYIKSTLSNSQNAYQAEKTEADLKALRQANEIQELKNKQSTFIMAGAIGVALVVLFIAYLLFKQNQRKNEVNLLLTQQNQLISNKKQEIENSIEYAKGIQNALLPDPNDIHKNLKNSFIYYAPKDVVSGDFYWFHEAGNYFYCIAADCTGHGVPGALMSIVSMDKLYQAVFEKKITEPSLILSFLNIEIKNALKQHNDEAKQKDGLDLALLRFNKDLTSVIYCGANRPLYHIRNGMLTEHKANKVAIAGFTPNEYEFNQQEISLNKNDTLYVFSDGYADQFGLSAEALAEAEGIIKDRASSIEQVNSAKATMTKGKKFMTKNFKTLVTGLSGKEITDQKREVIRTFEGWKGNYEQVDDILVIGIKI